MNFENDWYEHIKKNYANETIDMCFLFAGESKFIKAPSSVPKSCDAG